MQRVLAVLLLLAGACASHDADELTIARRHLRIVPCGSEPSIAGVAGVHHGTPRAAYLGDWIIISVCHLDELVKKADAEQKPLALFLQGNDFGNAPSGIDFETGQVTFTLDRNADNKTLWHPLLYNPLFDPTISLHASAGIKGGRPLPRAAGANTTIVLTKLYTDWTTFIWLALLAAIVIALVLYARHSDLVRDGPTIGGVRQTYSLARVQMAWWFFLILTGFSYIWMVTGDTDTISASLLALMGISAVTAVAAVAITAQEARATERAKIIAAEIDALDKAAVQVDADVEDAKAKGKTALAALLAQKRADLDSRREKLVVERAGLTATMHSKNFWRDLVTDDRGAVALDRFQIVAWTAVLGGVFLQSVVWDLSMPEFSATTLALMGISSGTYIGFKLPPKS